MRRQRTSPTPRPSSILVLICLASAIWLAGCQTTGDPRSPASSADTAGLPQGSDAIVLDPADFVPEVTHPYWPMKPGSRWVYRETNGAEMRIEITVLDEPRLILGIPATVVHDVVSLDGRVVEDTFDWYAQDVEGNLWYLGEDTTAFPALGESSSAGSWEAGVDGAQAGIILPGTPRVGQAYRQEYRAGRAEDQGRILSLEGEVSVPFGAFTDVLQTEDWTPLEPGQVEHKWYARGVGPILVESVSGSDREELLSFEPGPP